MINAIDLLHLRNDEHLQLFKDVAVLTLQNDPTSLNIKAQYDALALKNTELDALYKKQTASEITKELEALDDRRDRAVYGLKLVADGYQSHFDPTLSTAATRLSDNFKLYGDSIARQNLQSETNIINSIVSDFETQPDLADAIIALNLTAWKNELKTANTLFGTTYLKRTVEYSEVSKETLAGKREEANQVYYKLRKHIEANATLNDTVPGYATLIDQINALIEQYNLVVQKRRKKDIEETPEVDKPSSPIQD